MELNSEMQQLEDEGAHKRTPVAKEKLPKGIV
jgi:hypothetical protein